MTGKDLILAALAGERVTRAPWVPYTGVQIGSLKNIPADELYRDADKILDCLLEAKRHYLPDGMPALFDLQIEAEALGCELKWDPKAPPSVRSHPLELDKDRPLELFDRDAARVGMALDVLKRLRDAVGDEVAVYGLTTGPFTLASHLRGTSVFLDMYEDPDYVKRLVGFCFDVLDRMTGWMIDAGADVVAAVDPLTSQISPDAFEEYLSEGYSRYFASVRERGARGALFVCGDATKNLEPMAKTKPDCLSIDENVNLAAAKKITDAEKVAVSGNIPLTTAMLMGTQQDNMQYALDTLDALGDERFILAPGCDMPYDTPKDNIVGVAQAVRDPEKTRAFLETYEKATDQADVELPDYANLEKPLIECFTIDSATCPACGYMAEAAFDMVEEFGDRIDVVEYKMTTPENAARVAKLGFKNLPSLLINGELKYSSLIPNRNELRAEIEKAFRT
jgi:uroporphyrinogen decarboxylase